VSDEGAFVFVRKKLKISPEDTDLLMTFNRNHPFRPGGERLRAQAGLLLACILMLLMAGPAFVQGADAPPVAAQQKNDSTPLARFDAEIGRLAALTGGVVGVSAVHRESGRRVSFNGRDRFPMASTYKIAIAVQVLTLVDRGELDLERMVAVQREDLHPGSGVLTKLMNKQGLSLSIGNLFEIMMTISDNSATDLLLNLAGGPGVVTARMKALGIADLRIDRSTLAMIAEASGIKKLPPGVVPETFEKMERDVDPAVRRKTRKQFDGDPRDTASPEAMVSLLQCIGQRTCLSPGSADLLLDAMSRSQYGEARIKALLPPGTPVAHKSGTLAGTTNDVGVITLPDNAGHIALAIFVKASKKEMGERERPIAEISRAVYDFFLFSP
jgi:beta-lactamase class A